MGPAAVRSRTAAERAALARAVLARAEQQTGTTAWVRRPPTAVPGTSGHVPGEAVPGAPRADPAPAGAAARLEVAEGSAGPAPEPVVAGAPSEPGSAERVLPVHPTLAALLPRGALDRGATLVVGGSTSLVLALLAEASRAGSWAGLVGMPRVGLLAAHQLGLELDRLVLVPAPGADGPTVVAALLDGVDVVVVGDVALTDADRRRLSARARERGAVLLSTTPWPGAQVTLTAEVASWEGLGRGEGRLRARRLTVRGGGRGAAARGWSTQVVVPPPDVAGTREQGAARRVPASRDGAAAAGPAAVGPAAAGPGGGPGRDGSVVRGPWEGRRAG